MPIVIDGGSGEAARWIAMVEDRMTLAEFVRDRGTCDATGEPLDVGNAVAMTVTVSPGVSKLAVVTGAHWDTGEGPLSAADPNVDPDVLDGRQLFARENASPRPEGRERRQEPPEPRPGHAKPAQRLLRPASRPNDLRPPVW